MWKLNNMLLTNQQITDEIKEEIKKKYLETNDNENTIQNLRYGKSNAGDCNNAQNDAHNQIS